MVLVLPRVTACLPNEEELTGGAHGIETRYPFLDPRVVQEYLWLSRDLKNSEYKKPVADFLRRYNFPNLWGAKRGFAGHKNSVEVAATTTVGSLQSATVWDLHPSLDVAWRKKRRRDQRRRGQLTRERAGSIIHAEEATYQRMVLDRCSSVYVSFKLEIPRAPRAWESRFQVRNLKFPLL